MLLKSFGLFAALLLIFGGLSFSAFLRTPQTNTFALVKHPTDRPSAKRNPPLTGSNEKATLRHAILRNSDIDRDQADDAMTGKLRDYVKRRVQARSMT